MRIRYLFWKLILLIGNLAGAAWVGWEAGEGDELWRPITATATALAALIGAEIRHLKAIREQSLRSSASRKHDRRLFQKLKNDLSEEPTMRAMREQHFGARYNVKSIEELFDFENKWGKGAKYEFEDEEIEEIKEDLYDKVEQFTEVIASKGVPRNGPVSEVMPDQKRTDERDEAVEKINALADEVWRAYDDLIRTARKKLPPD